MPIRDGGWPTSKPLTLDSHPRAFRNVPRMKFCLLTSLKLKKKKFTRFFWNETATCFVNKVLVEHSHAHSLTSFLGLQWQSWVVVTEPARPMTSKMLTERVQNAYRETLPISALRPWPYKRSTWNLLEMKFLSPSPDQLSQAAEKASRCFNTPCWWPQCGQTEGGEPLLWKVPQQPSWVPGRLCVFKWLTVVEAGH